MTENPAIRKLKRKQIGTRIIGIVFLCIGLAFCLLAFYSLFFLIPGAFWVTAGLALTIRSFTNIKFALLKLNQESQPQQNTQPVYDQESAQREQTQPASLDALMTSQLVALHLSKNPGNSAVDYREQYILRLSKFGIPRSDAEKLFDFESEIIKKHNKQYLLSPMFTKSLFFGLRQPFFQSYPKEKDDILKERFLTMSELCKILDEAEWHYWNSHEDDVSDDVWKEIWQWRLKGAGGEFAVRYFDMIVAATGVKEESVGALGGAQGRHLSQYKWH